MTGIDGKRKGDESTGIEMEMNGPEITGYGKDEIRLAKERKVEVLR